MAPNERLDAGERPHSALGLDAVAPPDPADRLLEDARRSMNPDNSGIAKTKHTNTNMKKKLIIASIVAAITATTAYAWTQCLSCKGTGWNGNLKCYPCGGDCKIGD